MSSARIAVAMAVLILAPFGCARQDAPRYSLSDLQNAAHAGDARAQAVLALDLLWGARGLRVDQRRGAQLARLSAEAGHPFGVYVWADWCATGRAGPEEKAKARTYFRQCRGGIETAAQKGDVWAQATLAELLDYQDPDGSDLSESMRWYKRAAREGDARAMWGLANLVDRTLPLNRVAHGLANRRAVALWRKSWAEGFVRSGFRLGYDALHGKDSEEGISILRECAQQNYGPAIVELANALAEREIEGRHQAEGARILRAAAGQGNVMAMHELARWHEIGKGGVAKSTDLALDLFIKAAERGYVRSQVAVACRLCGFLGSGRYQPDFEAATFWAEKAAACGDPLARDLLADLLRSDGGPIGHGTQPGVGAPHDVLPRPSQAD